MAHVPGEGDCLIGQLYALGWGWSGREPRERQTYRRHKKEKKVAQFMLVLRRLSDLSEFYLQEVFASNLDISL